MANSEQVRKRRITDSVRLDWLAEHYASVTYRPNKIGAGWIQEATWYVETGSFIAKSTVSLRYAIDDAIRFKD